MKTKILSFILGGFTFLCIGAGVSTSTDILTIKPAVPKTHIVKEFVYQSNSDNVAEFIRGKVKDGWIVKQVSGANDGQYYSTWIVVMEKY